MFATHFAPLCAEYTNTRTKSGQSEEKKSSTVYFCSLNFGKKNSAELKVVNCSRNDRFFSSINNAYLLHEFCIILTELVVSVAEVTVDHGCMYSDKCVRQMCLII